MPEWNVWHGVALGWVLGISSTMIIVLIERGIWLRRLQKRMGKAKVAMAMRKLVRTEHKAHDTKKNAYGRICNKLIEIGMEKTEYGIQVIPLGIQNNGDCIVNIFWRNEYHAMGILGITIGNDSLAVESIQNSCPRGKPRNYHLALTEENVARAIDDIKTFMIETYRYAWHAAKMQARS
jgi:hypothetical protein